jgi:hypothetical protein
MSVKLLKEPVIHKDVFDRIITEGSTVAFPQSNSLAIGVVGKCTAKMVRVHPIGKHRGWRPAEGYLKYAHELVTVEGKDVTMYLLRNSV